MKTPSYNNAKFRDSNIVNRCDFECAVFFAFIMTISHVYHVTCCLTICP